MTKRVLDHNPLTGVTTYFEYTSDDRMVITSEQEISSIVDDAAAMRNNDEYSKAGIKNDQWHYARLPLSVIVQMKEKFGVDMMSPKIDWKSALKIINREYPHLKTTAKTHA
jgi:hypothetical protein